MLRRLWVALLHQLFLFFWGLGLGWPQDLILWLQPEPIKPRKLSLEAPALRHTLQPLRASGTVKDDNGEMVSYVATHRSEPGKSTPLSVIQFNRECTFNGRLIAKGAALTEYPDVFLSESQLEEYPIADVAYVTKVLDCPSSDSLYRNGDREKKINHETPRRIMTQKRMAAIAGITTKQLRAIQGKQSEIEFLHTLCREVAEEANRVAAEKHEEEKLLVDIKGD